jgi:acetylornithine deacetylase/succinyl-diaminopimelate desuccinylase-like protein
MKLARFTLYLVAALFVAGVLPAAAQLSPAEPDPLARIRDAAKTNVQACSATGETLCEQVAPKIIANAQSDSPLAENLRRLQEALKRQTERTGEEAPAVTWAMAALRDAGVDVHAEKYPVAPKQTKDAVAEIVVAEIRGREKPDEWILLGADLDPSDSGSSGVDEACNAALVVEAARDIQLTGVRPRRSIRFVLFGGESQGMTGPWAYLKGHGSELDRAAAAILFEAAANPLSGFLLDGRRDIESGVREALKPIESMSVTNLRFDAPFDPESFDFLLQGIPILVATEAKGFTPEIAPNRSNSLGKVNIEGLKRNTAIAAVTAFGVAERAEPIGPRQSRAEVESLLKTTGLDERMKNAGLWQPWESGERGRLP